MSAPLKLAYGWRSIAEEIENLVLDPKKKYYIRPDDDGIRLFQQESEPHNDIKIAHFDVISEALEAIERCWPYNTIPLLQTNAHPLPRYTIWQVFETCLEGSFHSIAMDALAYCGQGEDCLIVRDNETGSFSLYPTPDYVYEDLWVVRKPSYAFEHMKRLEDGSAPEEWRFFTIPPPR